jgi:hypothetical protein
MKHLGFKPLLGLAMVTGLMVRAGDVPISNFDTAGDATKWYWENWSVEAVVSFDGTGDAHGSASSGSMKVECKFPEAPGAYNQSVITLDLGGNIDAETAYSRVALDIRVDPSSAPRAGASDYGDFEVIFRNGAAWDWNSLGAVQLKGNDWTHVEYAVKAPGNQVHHLTLKLGQNAMNGTVIYEVDNIHWIERGAEVVVNNFDDASEVAGKWAWENWSIHATPEFAPDEDAGGGADGSGSMKLTMDFPEAPANYNQSVVSLDLHNSVNAESTYKTLSLDVKVDPSSVLRAGANDYGTLEMIFRNGPNWDWNSLGGYALTGNGWTHLTYTVKAPGDKVHHLTLKLGQNGMNGPVILYVDNIRWTETATEVPPPTMSIQRAKPGLNLMTGSPGLYDRQNIATITSGLGWVGSTDPVSYSMTIKEWPSAATYPGFSGHIYLVPGTPGAEEYPDWTEPTVVLIGIDGNADGSGSMTFHYKVDAPNSNGQNVSDGQGNVSATSYFNTDPTHGPVGQLGTVNGKSIVGTWTVTIQNDTAITLTAPDGTQKTVSMPAEDAAKFAGDIKVYFGVQPNQDAAKGQTGILGGVKVQSGSNVLIEDTFSAPLDPSLWKVSAASPASVLVVPDDASFFVSWTTPASGYVLQTNTGFDAGSWADSPLKDALIGAQRRVFVPSDSLPAPEGGYFRLLKQ